MRRGAFRKRCGGSCEKWRESCDDGGVRWMQRRREKRGKGMLKKRAHGHFCGGVECGRLSREVAYVWETPSCQQILRVRGRGLGRDGRARFAWPSAPVLVAARVSGRQRSGGVGVGCSLGEQAVDVALAQQGVAGLSKRGRARLACRVRVMWARLHCA